MTADSMIDYEALAQEAMRSVVRSVLTEAAAKGLPGDHHFYISFDTLAPGVILSKRLREKYAEEMTIVLQHRFWDLIINDHRFEVKLTFDGIPERLVVPFKAIRVFFDPSVRYGLQFESVSAAMELAGADEDGRQHFDDPFTKRPFAQPVTAPPPNGPEVPPQPSKKAPAQAGPARIGRAYPGAVSDAATGGASKAKTRSRDGLRGKDTAQNGQRDGEQLAQPSPVGEPEGAETGTAGAEIVSLDAFRKK